MSLSKTANSSGAPPWEHLFKDLADSVVLTREVSVALPCCGVAASRRIFELMGIKYKACCIYDLDDRYDALLAHCFGRRDLHLGPTEGDILRVPVTSLTMPVDILLAGPPCPPWSGLGKRQGEGDVRAAVFDRVVKWVEHLAHHNGLSVVILENVVGCRSYMQKIQKKLKRSCAMLTWDMHTARAEDYSLPQSRVRLFLRGLRTVYVPRHGLPAPLSPFGAVPLKSLLIKNLPCTPKEDLTRPLWYNVRLGDVKNHCRATAGEIGMDAVVVFPVDRCANRVFPQVYSVNKAPTLTTKNAGLFVLSVGDYGKDDDRREFFRLLQPEERFLLQGLSATDLSFVPPNAAIKAAGNAYPSAVLGAMMAPLLVLLGDHSAARKRKADEQ